ncbi:ABC transporter ATP-binding protein [Roseomonas eburnea]|uniref:ABC transporter ATP-binding protein n=1 Tax=Neoroseomonas eburnea TaxID=1346889 RepID=A0A9X9XEA4_9PROT|nr:ABC transporter ATP-binding protein [Neoroseomonas eburnea]MBR0682040.1 ABC transporter ATP-binding protein [Neoroseomonas eburnea]
MADPVLQVAGLRAGYGPAEVLFGVELHLARGEVAALMGRNGAGKSTTLKAIMGLLPPRGGSVRFAGQEIAGQAPYRIARLGLGYVPEDRRIFTDLTVTENLEVGRRAAPPGRAPWTPERLFEFFPNLAEMRHRRAGAMSGGEQQMLTIARSLMGNPEAVLLDEPSEGLAPVIVEQMAEAVLRMKAEGIAVLVSEQNLDFAGAVADRALILEKGSVRWQGSIATLEADEDVRRAHLTV